MTVRASPLGTSPRTSYSSRSEHPVRFPDNFAGLSHGAPSISFGAPSVDKMSIAASGDGFNRPPSPEPSRLDYWFLGAGHGSQPRSAPVPFFPEVHEELTKSWMAPFTARSRSPNFLHPHYPRRRGCQGVRGHSPGEESDHGAPVPTKRRHLEEPSMSPVQSL